MSWFVDQFGTAWLESPVVSLTDEFFPGAYDGTEHDIRRVVANVCGYMDVAPERIRVVFSTGGTADRRGASRWTTTTGSSTMAPTTAPDVYIRSDQISGHHRAGAKSVITLDTSICRNPLLLVATIARALAYERLVSEKRMTAGQVAREPVDELLTVFLGLGVITANAALEFSHATTDEVSIRATEWTAGRLGRLTEPMYGYALARYAVMRGERRPRWIRTVDTNPRVYLRKSLRYLRRSA
ncbi:hypothetical protein [Actinoplanes sp. NPDC005259]